MSNINDEGGEPPETAPQNSSKTQKSSLRALVYKLRKAFGFKPHSLQESLDDMIERQQAAGTPVARSERTMLRNVVAFNELEVEDIMIPRADMFAIEQSCSFDEIKQRITSGKTYTRIPIYKESMDDVRGFLHVKDMVTFLARGERGEDFDMTSLVREVIFVPPSMAARTLLLRMQQQRVHLAIVVDEYGGTDGLVTLEDIVEQIIGDIEDEHDMVQEVVLTQHDDGTIEASARVEIKALEDILGFTLASDSDEYDTIGGLISAYIGRVPQVGENIEYEAPGEKGRMAVFSITKADDRSIHDVKITAK